MKALIAVLVVLLAVLQWRFWIGDGGIRERRQLAAEVQELTETLNQQRDVNTALRAEVADLVDGVNEIEERARSELGMVGPGETFYQFVGTRPDVPADNLAKSNAAADAAPVNGQSQ